MRKISVPINIETITEENLPRYIESVKKCKAYRVFLIGMDFVYHKSSVIYREPERLELIIKEFKKAVKEVGFWISTLGHGASLNFMETSLSPRHYTPIEGINGEISEHGYCPLDENFRKDLGEGLKALAAFHPDIIMLDDDFRFHSRSYYMGCFCPKHLKEYYKRIGEEVPRENLEQLIWCGGENKYRTAYMHLMGDTLKDFATELREQINKVDPTIRFGCCCSPEAWDVNGIDILELAKSFAGNTEPFTRISCAPYWNKNIIKALETSRLEFMWSKNSGVETMSEGDTYPRPRYNCPSKTLELFDLLLIANNQEDALLNYIYEYNYDLNYESGYEERYIKNENLREAVAEIFKGKTPVGVEIFQNMHILEKMEFPETAPKQLHRRVIDFYQVHSDKLLSENTISTCFEPQGYPIFLVGENAKYIDPERLNCGAILDVKSAEILTRRGIDVGLIEANPCSAESEYFTAFNDRVNNLGACGLYALNCKASAKVLGRYLPDNTVSAYRYENGQNQRFLVLGYDAYLGNLSSNYYNNYYRQTQLIDSTEWLSGKKLPATCRKNPCLYMLTSKNEDSMAVALANIFLDDVLSPEIELDKAYSKIRFVNCNGRLEGNKVYLSDIVPYGFAAFEVK